MIDFFKDYQNILKIKEEEKIKKICFFNESKFTFKYLKPYLNKKRTSKSIVVSFEEVNELKDKEYYVIKTLFFQTLFFLIHKFLFFYTTTPDLDTSSFFKSIFKKTKYIYLQHSHLSLTHAYKKESFINFDVVQAVNVFQNEEIKKINKIFNKKIKCFRGSYKFIENQKKINLITNKKKIILIAPTWSTNFYNKDLHYKLFKILKSKNIDFVFRPHPMSIKKKEININEIKDLKINFDEEKEIQFEKYSNLVTDWSGIYFEFAIIKKIFPILINSEQKIRNESLNLFSNWEPIEIKARDEICYSIPIDQLEKVAEELLKDSNKKEREIIENFIRKYFY